MIRVNSASRQDKLKLLCLAVTTDTKNSQQNIALIFFIYWLIDFLAEGKKNKTTWNPQYLPVGWPRLNTCCTCGSFCQPAGGSTSQNRPIKKSKVSSIVEIDPWKPFLVANKVQSSQVQSSPVQSGPVRSSHTSVSPELTGMTLTW